MAWELVPLGHNKDLSTKSGFPVSAPIQGSAPACCIAKGPPLRLHPPVVFGRNEIVLSSLSVCNHCHEVAEKSENKKGIKRKKRFVQACRNCQTVLLAAKYLSKEMVELSSTSRGNNAKDSVACDTLFLRASGPNAAAVQVNGIAAFPTAREEAAEVDAPSICRNEDVAIRDNDVVSFSLDIGGNDFLSLRYLVRMVVENSPCSTSSVASVASDFNCRNCKELLRTKEKSSGEDKGEDSPILSIHQFFTPERQVLQSDGEVACTCPQFQEQSEPYCVDRLTSASFQEIESPQPASFVIREDAKASAHEYLPVTLVRSSAESGRLLLNLRDEELVALENQIDSLSHKSIANASSTRNHDQSDATKSKTSASNFCRALLSMAILHREARRGERSSKKREDSGSPPLLQSIVVHSTFLNSS